MIKRIVVILSVLGLLLILFGCGAVKGTSDNIKGKIQVIVVDRLQNPIKDAKVIFVGGNKYLGKALTDSQGKTSEINIDASLDPLVKEVMDKNFRRGVVNIIVLKDGYKDDVVFEAWIYENTVSSQIIRLDSKVENERNEPEYTVAEPHRLEVIKYVDYYKDKAK